MNTFTKQIEADRRLSVLLFLAESSNYQANQFLLQDALDGVGHAVSMDRLRADFAWLAEQGLVEVSVAGQIDIPKLTARGLDVAQGRASVPGVKRPRPD
jgi:hypothetical protein